jgi:hypothetical protein
MHIGLDRLELPTKTQFDTLIAAIVNAPVPTTEDLLLFGEPVLVAETATLELKETVQSILDDMRDMEVYCGTV